MARHIAQLHHAKIKLDRSLALGGLLVDLEFKRPEVSVV
jgi:hypothetical protein